MASETSLEYTLGLDLGTNSLGWAIVRLVDGEPAGLVRAGVRVFDAGMEGDIESGREESRNLQRREARLHRRLLWRRARRLRKVFNLLQRFGLLPDGDASAPDRRQAHLNNLDNTIRTSAWFQEKAAMGRNPEPDQTLPYILRASALDERLEPHFLGRALYHLAQRRGFLSNRKAPAKKAEDVGVVKKQIGELREKMHEAGARTLGEYFSHLKPSEERIRCRWTARDMYEEEFEKIWAAQTAHHPDLLAEDRRELLRKAMFFQRPLWFDPATIGQCELEPGQQRAPKYLLVSQRFRLLQTVNNLKVLPPGEPERDLTPADRKKLIEALELEGDLTFKQIRKLLGLPEKPQKYEFNLERGGEKTLKGNRTNADFYKIFGKRWLEMSAEERQDAVRYVYAFQKPDKLKEAARRKWSLSEEEAEKLAAISLEPDYLNLSRQAIEKLLPLLEDGVPYGEARKKVYPESFEPREVFSFLPPVSQALPEIRNPAVMRSLTELRKVVNAVVRQFGKPVEIHLELARELKKSKKQREAISENMRRNEKARAEAAKKIMAEAGIAQPRPDDIRKYLLAEESRWECPYTGRSISMAALFGPEPQFDIEHIIPFSRSMDNSFQNLTLCHVPENRAVKGNRTPHQAYSGDPDRYEAILDRVRRFAGDRRTVAAKLQRFTMNDDELEVFLADFRNRQLNDTAYASALAAKYLGLLYGGLSDAEGNRRIQATSGQSTSYFRNLWKLNQVLNDGPSSDGGAIPKSRDDHRHHAVDAVVIALTSPAMIKRLADAAERAPREGRRRFGSLKAPWPGFVETVREEINRVIVSHRVSKKVSGALHEETNYAAPNGEQGDRRVRKPLPSLTKQEVAAIADEHVKKLVLEKLGDGDPKKVFADEKNLPFFETADGRRIPIKRVRIRKAVPTFPLRNGPFVRHVTSESNHHVEIFAEIDENGNEIEWEGRVVSMTDAYERVRIKSPVIDRACERGETYKMSLCQGETIECDEENGATRFLVCKGFSQFSAGPVVVSLLPVKDARKNPKLIRVVPNTLRKWNARKVVVSPLGEVTEAHD